MDPKHLPITATLLLACGAPAFAQSYAVQISAPQPLSVQANLAAQSSTQTQPAGALPASGAIAASVGAGSSFANSRFSWDSEATDTHASVDITGSMLSLSNPSITSASFGPNQLLVEFLPTGAPGAVIDITRAWDALAGAAIPSIQIDLGNDLTIDLSGPIGTITLPIPAGQVYPVRIIMQADLPTGGLLSNVTVHLEVRPDNNVFVSPTISHCMNYGPTLSIEQTFQNQGIALQSTSVTDFAVMVIGFSPIFAPLPIQGSPLPCILLPNPDLALLIPQFSTLTLPIALPPAVRPATLFVQSIAVSGQAELLGVTQGYTILAQ